MASTSGETKPADASAGENLRAYGGEDGGIRVARRRATLIDAALELLGASDGGSITVRGVCREAGLTTRYFYESFDSIEALVAATFDGVIGEIAELAVAAFDSGDDVESKVRAAVGAIVAVIDEDRRKGRLLFSQALLSPTIAAKRMESTEIFAALTVESASGVVEFKSRPRGMAAAHFQVGGLGRVLAAWLEGHLDLDREGVVDVSVGLMMALADGVARFG